MFSPKSTGLMFTLIGCYWVESSGGLFLANYIGVIHECENGRLWLKHPHGFTCVGDL